MFLNVGPPLDQDCRTKAMDQEPATWIKKEETDEVKTELHSMAQVYPFSMNVKEELEEGANKESIEDPLGISWSTDFIKEDPELNLELSAAENIVETSTRYASDSARIIIPAEVSDI
ncbi:uncharacterized protein LOC126427022 isoform X3 [Schistocerca serialis cubense]|uniref:uncharacterized protein LOC126427022 isoform X3 n=1 Tax=Schistocerca serialis cubense TaxID=2023355 RepID=UPI00214E6145|nr:uncharacterized protein LOC126427022 isoform X3 [Schistocerca serialis cubense]